MVFGYNLYIKLVIKKEAQLENMEINYMEFSTNGIICYYDKENGKSVNDCKNFTLPRIKIGANLEKVYEVMKVVSKIMDKKIEGYYIQIKYKCCEEEENE